MRVSHLIPAICLPVLLSCSTMPVYKKPEVAVPKGYKESGIWQPAQPSDRLDRGDWWKAYHDPTLDELVIRLDASNPDLAAAVAHFDQATAFLVQVSASLFPTVNVGASAVGNRQSNSRPLRPAGQASSYGDNSLGLTADYELDLWGHVRSEVAAGKAEAQAAAADLESVRLSLRAQLSIDYVDIRSLDSQIYFLRDVVESYSRALAITEYRFQGGVDSALDTAQAKAQLDTAKAALIETISNRALIEHAIASLVGEPASTFTIPPAKMEMRFPNIPVGIPSDLLQRRPDIAAAERRVAEANAQIGVAKAAFYPTILLGAAGGFESANFTDWLSAPNIFWIIGPSALLTIFDADRREAVVREAEAVYRASGANYRSTVLHAFQEVEDNLSLLSELAKESVEIEAAVIDTNQALNISMNRYREGTVNYLQVVTAQTAALQVELTELQLLSRRFQASVNLVRALGGGYNAPDDTLAESEAASVNESP